MIIFGTRSKTLKSKTDASMLNCGHCGSTMTVSAFTTFKYFHIFWIPIFPYSKKLVLQCSHCKSVQYQHEIDKEYLNQIKSTTVDKIALKYYFGLILIGLFFALIIFNIVSNSLSLSKNIKNPEVGDVYEIQYKSNGKRAYTTYRIVSVTPDSLTFEMNDYEVTSVTKLDDLQRQHKNDYSEKKTISKSVLDSMYNGKMINGINKAKK